MEPIAKLFTMVRIFSVEYDDNFLLFDNPDFSKGIDSMENFFVLINLLKIKANLYINQIVTKGIAISTLIVYSKGISFERIIVSIRA